MYRVCFLGVYPAAGPIPPTDSTIGPPPTLRVPCASTAQPLTQLQTLKQRSVINVRLPRSRVPSAGIEAGKPSKDQNAAAQPPSRGQKYVTPLLVVLLALAVLVTITRNWNSWEGGKAKQVTDDAYVRGDLTPLSTKVAGIVRDVRVSDFQTVHQGDLLVQFDDADYQAHVAQANAPVAAAKAAIETLLLQSQLDYTQANDEIIHAMGRTPE